MNLNTSGGVRMGNVLGWLGRAVVIVLVLVMAAVTVGYVASSTEMNKTYTIALESLVVPDDDAAIARGEHIALTVTKCVDCHGENLGGEVFIDDPALGRFVASNLTTGRGGIGNRYQDPDWIRAIRHGVGPDGAGLFFMPSDEYYFLGDEDLRALIAYLKKLPAVDNELPETSVGPVGRALYLAGQLPLIAAERIDHDAAPPEPPPTAVTAEYGGYLATVGGCVGCHGPGLSGGPVPGTPPEFPPAANITPAGAPGQWSEEDFFSAMRSGTTPDGRQLDPFMPWKAIGQMTDAELQALWLHLQTVSPKEYGNR
jgi:mono/diheme cytochrome c family protein